MSAICFNLDRSKILSSGNRLRSKPLSYIILYLFQNQAPVFTSPTLAISVVENESGQVLLYTLTVSDADNDPLTCSIQSTIPNTFDFGVWKNSSGNLLDISKFYRNNLRNSTFPNEMIQVIFVLKAE